MNIGEADGSDGRRLDIIRYKKDFMSKKMRIKIQNSGNMLKNSKIQKKFGPGKITKAAAAKNNLKKEKGKRSRRQNIRSRDL